MYTKKINNMKIFAFFATEERLHGIFLNFTKLWMAEKRYRIL